LPSCTRRSDMQPNLLSSGPALHGEEGKSTDAGMHSNEPLTAAGRRACSQERSAPRHNERARGLVPLTCVRSREAAMRARTQAQGFARPWMVADSEGLRAGLSGPP
jgi:hypothetical protein